MPKIDRKAVYNKFGGRCAYCGYKIEFKNMQVDHIIPKRSGGTDDMENLFPSCRTCNHYKRDNPIWLFRKWIAEIPEKLYENQYIFKVGVKYGFFDSKVREVKFYYEKESEVDK